MRRAPGAPLVIAKGTRANSAYGSRIRACFLASRRWLKSRRIIRTAVLSHKLMIIDNFSEVFFVVFFKAII
jgi:hypothetical protein